MALGITGGDQGTPMAGKGRPQGVGLRRPSRGPVHDVAEDIRVGISKAVDHPWRFLSRNHPHVSVAHGKVKGR
jgi:DNA-3-methyladenine glycosylase